MHRALDTVPQQITLAGGFFMSLSPKSENLLSPVRMEWKNIRRLLIEAGLNRSEITELKKCYMLRAAAAEADAILPRRCIEVKLPSAQRRDAQQSVSACAEQSNILRENQLQALQDAFRRYSGAELVFNKAGLPGQGYFEKLPPLVLENRVRAAQIALREVRMYPPGYLDGIGLKTIGIFDACVSETND
ncbi:MAG TPA: hypothetical protein PLP17_02945, partial [Oligoflexia bacterium]|nr:hypothetical protein [Oligoflexia bacterium]